MAAIRGTNGLPAFSMSSSTWPRGNTVAQPTGPALRRAKRSAPSLRQNRPPNLPSASRATQQPSRLRPIKHRDRLAEDFRIGAQKRRDFRLFLFRKDVGCKRPQRELLGKLPTCARPVELFAAGCCVH
jgi:hypothetical protein